VTGAFFVLPAFIAFLDMILIILVESKNYEAHRYLRGPHESKASFFFRKDNSDNNEIYEDDSHIFCNYEAIFPHMLHSQHTFAYFEQDAVYHCCKIPCLDFGAYHERYKETLHKTASSHP
jgi:hypothetical protein